ncbi:hypothetical protein [Streptococcus cuniculipharyngis]|uniref:Uncharacterized protein n=1 Tax=Streptococcus cuniculipharyngis TaxID=1562651 RepID=A0A5C5SDG7_9STRE|nr:hypothetical protein [Streptococcus cuniculipharyngis]TWS98028.1 hypothetical protein FRX57_03615 [Streptococcus cuniculipharyngis]
MTYEFSLEYGTYPVKEILQDPLMVSNYEIPQFLEENTSLRQKLEEMNDLFHELFMTLECQSHYIGHEFPDKIAQIRHLYEESSQELVSSYPELAFKIEHFLL